MTHTFCAKPQRDADSRGLRTAHFPGLEPTEPLSPKEDTRSE